MEPPTMSLVAQFDEICRRRREITTAYGEAEKDFLAFVKNQEECRKKWLAAENKAHHYQGLYQQILAEKSGLEANLLHARKAIQVEMSKRIHVEQEKSGLEQQIALIRELLHQDGTTFNDQTREKLAFLNCTVSPESPKRLETIDESSGSMLSSDDISYDTTRDSINADVEFARVKRATRSGDGVLGDDLKRRQDSNSRKEVTPPKKIKVCDGSSLRATTTVEIPTEGSVTATAIIETRNSKHNRNISDPAFVLTSEPIQSSRNQHPSGDEGTGDNYAKVCKTPRTPNNWAPLRTFLSATKLQNRPHDFVTKTIYKPEPCMPCGKKITFGKAAYKCKDCRTICHIDCKDQAPLPCVPVVNTPTVKGSMGSIADYTPLSPPMVPGIVIHCANEVEARGLSEVGIYRVPGSEKEVKDLKEKFLRGKGIPNLSRVDVHCICGCLKDFLRSLKEPLVTHTLWKDFVAAAETPGNQDDLSSMYQAISELPQPNRDTLAFLILHLQRVAESTDCRMNASNLAKIFGPTIVGYSSLDPEPFLMLNETKKQAAVMERLINIPSDYWSNFVNVEYDKPGYNTPDPIDHQDRRSSLSKGKGHMVQTPLGPRDTTRKTRLTRKSSNFFSSPMLQ